MHVTAQGTEVALTLRVGGDVRSVLGEISLHESVAQGTQLAVTCSAEDGETNPGEVVELQWRSADEHDGAARLWCSEVRDVDDRGFRTLVLQAVDPLTLGDREPDFRSHAGPGSLAGLVRGVLAVHPGALEGLKVESLSDPAVTAPYLFQCRESGAAFLRRIAASVDGALCWTRDRVVVSTLGRAPGREVRLEQGRELQTFELVRAVESALSSAPWIDPGTRRGSSSKVSRKGWSGAPGAPGVVRPVRSSVAPPSRAGLGEGRVEPWPGTIFATTIRADIRLGDIVVLPSGERGAVVAVQHDFSGAGGPGSYSNRVTAIPEVHWGRSTRVVPETVLGPFQAVVMETDDPERMGRLRIALSEDPERRTSPWVPMLTPASGANTGFFWMPEKGSAVIVVAPAGCPEEMVVLGAVRGEHDQIATEWRSTNNSRKALAFRNGVSIVADDERGTLKVRAGDTIGQLDRTGEFKLEGTQLSAEFKRQVTICGHEHVKVDGARIDLG